ncbi:TspO/MBR family protein [Saprospira grandis]|uniref:TspO/MBR family protein n=1 Tax=Saprospira grandis TaxID=1008 RepID=UPI0022DDCA9E|nr:TspO/MBR family protein [Saprospira grandis]WBM74439.1 tryptophan-rich sensory protein [Saprospira grandis]
MKNWSFWQRLLLALLLCFGVAALGGWATAQGLADWYPQLQKPSFNPPGYLFGPVWTLLYTLMAIAWAMVEGKGNSAKARFFFLLQLGLNGLWSFLFFFAQSPGAALVEIALLWASIFYCIRLFWSIQPKAAYFLFPYLAWVSFAALLNASIYLLNS